jgi:hypothetical protein
MQMIWWTGYGFWIGLLISLCVYAGDKAFGHLGGEIGLICAAVILFPLKYLFDESTSFFSVPLKFWPQLLILLFFIFLIGDWRTHDGIFRNQVVTSKTGK